MSSERISNVRGNPELEGTAAAATHRPRRAPAAASTNHERVEVLSLEYNTLRAEILVRTTARFQFLGLVTTASAILATGSRGAWVLARVLACLAGGVFVVGVLLFWGLGRNITYLSARVAVIESRINELVSPGSVCTLLSWESGHQSRTLFDRLVLGLRSVERDAPAVSK